MKITQNYELDYIGFSNEDGDGCMAVFVAFPDIKGVGDTFEEAREDAYEQLERYLKRKENTKMHTPFEAGIEAYERKAYPDAHKYFTSAVSEQNNPDAMINLAIMHMKGIGCDRDMEKAKQWFVKASDAGNGRAMASLAHIHEKGLDGFPNKDEALKYYAMAANTGMVDAQLKAGMMFREMGENAKAMQYLITAAHNQNKQAQEIITYVSNAGTDGTLNRVFRSMDEASQKKVIETMIETKIKPMLEGDNGGIELINYIPGATPQVWLRYLGACSGCHLGSTSTADMVLKEFETLIDKNIVLYLM